MSSALGAEEEPTTSFTDDDAFRNTGDQLYITNSVLSTLLGSIHPLTALELSTSLEITKILVNRSLYALLRRGKVKSDESSNPPLWTYNRESNNERENQLLECMQKHSGGASTESIAWSLRESKASVNRILYDLEKDGTVERLQLSPPIWRGVLKPATKKRQPQISVFANAILKARKRQRLVSSDPKDGVGQASESLDKKQQPYSTRHPADGVENESALSKEIADAVKKKFRSLKPDATNRDIVAGFVVRNIQTGNNIRVVAIGTGTKCLLGDKLSLEGAVIHDSHAEIVARRSLIRWLYSQLSNADTIDSIARRTTNNTECAPLFELRPLELWLYVSQSPCGDATVFSRSDPQPKTTPCFSAPKHGALRTKVEQGQGTVPTKGKPIQTFDGLKLGDRAMSHSCSDKLARWGIVGVQGGLLSRLIAPFYLTGIVIGDIFSYGHACRALCCRSETALAESSLSDPFQVQHLRFGHAPSAIERAARTKKRDSSSLNWTEIDKDNVEIVDGRTGRRVDGQISRICKASLFKSFSEIYPPSARLSYSSNKALAKEYQLAKKMWAGAMKERYGPWIAKPCEVDDFCCKKESSSEDASSDVSWI